MTEKQIIKQNNLKDRIYTIRGLKVMLDRELAELYEVETKVLNQAVKRNIKRFPKDFMFQLSKEEQNKLVTNCDHLKMLKFSYQNSFVFTEQGVAMLSGILKSKRAIEVNIQIMRAFVTLRKFILNNEFLFQKIDFIERKQINTDLRIDKVFELIESNDIKQKQGIFFNGQIFDAHKFVSDLIKTAKESITLIDNYIDYNTLLLFSETKFKVVIYTKEISEKLKLDTKKYNQQYNNIKIKEFKDSHDRFIIIDDTSYHFGASLKDLGKKWFAFFKFENKNTFKEITNKLNQQSF